MHNQSQVSRDCPTSPYPHSSISFCYLTTSRSHPKQSTQFFFTTFACMLFCLLICTTSNIRNFPVCMQTLGGLAIFFPLLFRVPGSLISASRDLISQVQRDASSMAAEAVSAVKIPRLSASSTPDPVIFLLLSRRRGGRTLSTSTTRLTSSEDRPPVKGLCFPQAYTAIERPAVI